MFMQLVYFLPNSNILLVWKFLHQQYCSCLEYKIALGDNMTRLQIAQEAFLLINVDVGTFLSLFVGPPCTWGVKSHCNKHNGSMLYALRLKLASLVSIHHVDHLGYNICALLAPINGWIIFESCSFIYCATQLKHSFVWKWLNQRYCSCLEGKLALGDKHGKAANCTSNLVSCLPQSFPTRLISLWALTWQHCLAPHGATPRWGIQSPCNKTYGSFFTSIECEALACLSWCLPYTC